MSTVDLPDLERRWIEDAACQGMPSSVFFPEPDDENFVARPLAYKKAKAVCRHCPVLALCQRDTLGEVDGIWGGMDPKERRKLRRERSLVVNQWSDEAKLAYGQMITDLRPGMVWSEISRLTSLNLTAVMYLHQWLESYTGGWAEPALRVAADVSHKTPASKVSEIIQLSKEGVSLRGIARELELTTNTVRKYLTEHALATRPVLDFPDHNPPWQDGWAKHTGRCVAGSYMGQTDDGAWILMKIHASMGGQTAIGWFREDDVKLTRDVAVVIRKRQGGRSRIYGNPA